MTPYARMLAAQIRPEAQPAFGYEYARYAKDPAIALALAIVLGIVGGEAYYLGDYKRGVLMSLGLLSGIGVLITIPLWICRCFTIQGECESYNDYLAYWLALRYWPVAQDECAPEPPPAPQARTRPNIVNVPVPLRSV